MGHGAHTKETKRTKQKTFFEVIELAKILGRSAGSVALKLKI